MQREFVEGESIEILERIVVAPDRGRFRPLDTEVVGTIVAKGDIVGLTEQRGRLRSVVSTFDGRVVGMLVHPGELVLEGAPIAWLRPVEVS